MEAAFPINRLAGLLAGLLLAACGPSGPLPTDLAAIEPPAPAPSQTPVPATPTPLPTATPTATPSPSPTATWTASPTPTATDHPCTQAPGTVTRHTLATDLSPLPWEFRVYAPPCYDAFPEQRYPLLILIHGSTYTDSQWDDLGADETADRLIAAGELPPFLILMPRDRIWVEPTEDPFGVALVSRILPWVDENYRTIPEKPYRAIGGLSRGASWAVHLGLKHLDLFYSIGAHSLPVFLTDPPRLRSWLDQAPVDELPRFYLDIGDRDYLLDKAIWFEELLTEKNIPHEWYLNSGRHEDAYWAGHVEEYLRWYAAPWMAEEPEP